MSEEEKELIKQLKALNENLDALAKITAVSVGKDDIFKGMKKKEEKIKVLDKIGLPRSLIAIVTGSTPESVSSFKSMKRTKPSKPKTSAQTVTPQEQGEKKDEQTTV